MRVRNLNGDAKATGSGKSWLARWEALSGQTAYGCFVVGCHNKRSVGGRVQKDSTADTRWYIVPLCEECNKKTGRDLEIWDLAKLIPAGEPSGKPHAGKSSTPRTAGMEST